MIKLEVGKTYARNDSVKFTVDAFVTDIRPDRAYALEYRCSDGMWRNEAGEAFPGATLLRYVDCNTSREIKSH